MIFGLTPWQALFDHAHLLAGQTVLIHGAAGGVGSIAVQLARQVGSRVIGTGRPPTETVVEVERGVGPAARQPDLASAVQLTRLHNPAVTSPTRGCGRHV